MNQDISPNKKGLKEALELSEEIVHNVELSELP